MIVKRHIQDWKTHVDVLYVFIEDDQIVGSGKLTWNGEEKKRITLSHIYVSEPYRGMKYGNMIMATLEEAARDEFNASVLYLWVEENTFMYNWYRSRNYHFHRVYEEAPNTVWLKRKIN